jgi:hypothetical protein
MMAEVPGSLTGVKSLLVELHVLVYVRIEHVVEIAPKPTV